MIYLTKEEIEQKLEDLSILNELNLTFYEDNIGFTINDEITMIFPMEHNKLNLAIDQIIMTGHYLYGKNEDFRKTYQNVYDGKEFSITYRNNTEARKTFTKDLFNLFLYGIVTSSYINTLPEKPFHYFARPIADEKNTSLMQFLQEEHQKDKKYMRKDGTPFYNYIMKKSFVIPSNNKNCADISICPISDIIPAMKLISGNINKLAVYVFKKLINSGIEENVKFCKTFIDSSWSPYLQAN